MPMGTTGRCPRCGAVFVRGTRHTLDTGECWELGCDVCGLAEDRPSNAPDYGEWRASWARPRSRPATVLPVPAPAPFSALLAAPPRAFTLLTGRPVAFAAPPEFLPFGSLRVGGPAGDPRGDAYLGWIVPAPELGLADHPVGLVSSAEPTKVWQLGNDIRSGFAAILDIMEDDLLQWQGTDIDGSIWAWAGPIQREGPVRTDAALLPGCGPVLRASARG